MSIKQILSSKQHYIHPFQFEDSRHHKESLSNKQKVASVGLGILIGSVTFGIGGIVAFYISTAAFKEKICRANKNEPAPLPPAPAFKDSTRSEKVAAPPPESPDSPPVVPKSILKQPGAPKKDLHVHFADQPPEDPENHRDQGSSSQQIG